jgi:hypothetical protein
LGGGGAWDNRLRDNPSPAHVHKRRREEVQPLDVCGGVRAHAAEVVRGGSGAELLLGANGRSEAAEDAVDHKHVEGGGVHGVEGLHKAVDDSPAKR